MKDLVFQAAGVAFHLRGDPFLIDQLSAYYSQFPQPSDHEVQFDVEWQGESCVWKGPDGENHTLKVAKPDFRGSATTILLTQLLGEGRRDLLIFHGNGLWNPAAERLVMILGDSGAGKSTLSMEMLKDRESWRLVAEDVLILDPREKSLQPFPRAASIRREDAIEPLLPWHHIGGEEPTKGLKTHQNPDLTPHSLDRAGIFLLSDSKPGKPPEGREFIWVSYLDEALGDHLERAGLPVEDYELGDDSSRLVFKNVLENPERQRLHELLERHGSIILHAEAEGSVKGRREQRPPEPLAHPLKVSDGVVGMLHFLRRHPARVATEPAGMILLQIGQALENARFYRFEPGGTPAESAKYLEDLALPG